MRRRLILSSLVLSVLVNLAYASGCAVMIPNIEFCRDKGKFGAVCAFWLNANETKRAIPLMEWNSKRLGMVCTSEKGTGNVNAIIAKLCQTHECVQKVTDLIKAIE